ncbi:MAG: hypothetical protein M1823_005855 [Watsoniomyces obsoletus]|nr:MAG: hypothetical protein M1823_005855 [Watsoniomyces obsoletus]
MKFGRNLPRNQVPEWSSAYIDYKGLKKLIRLTAENVKNGGEPDLAVFFYTLDRNLEDVDGFYNKKLFESSRRLKRLEARYGGSAGSTQNLGSAELVELRIALLEARGQLRKLQWYGDLNRRGFIKITKKLDKKIPSAKAQQAYVRTKLNPKQFATNEELSRRLDEVNDWLSKLADLESIKESNLTSSVEDRKQMNVSSASGPVDENMEMMLRAISNDDAKLLSERLHRSEKQTGDDKAEGRQPLKLHLLLHAMECQAQACMDVLLDRLESLESQDGINNRSCLHRLVIACAGSSPARSNGFHAEMEHSNPNRLITPATTPTFTPLSGKWEEQADGKMEGIKQASFETLEGTLEKLRPHHRRILLARDSYGRLPLHYAAEYGLVNVCQLLIDHMQQWDQYDVAEGVDGTFWQDSEGWAPVHLSALAGHHRTTKIFLDSEQRDPNDSEAIPVRNSPMSKNLLRLVTKANDAKLVRLLMDAGFHVNDQDDQGEAALHVAARLGHDDCVQALLEGNDQQKAETELAEKLFAWTPLFMACVEGHLRVVELLIDAGAQLDRMDLSGWTAKEHAVLRGHLDIARRLPASLPVSSTGTESSTSLASSPLSTSPFGDRRPSVTNGESGMIRRSESIKTFGHRYLRGESLVLVSLGSMDTRKAVEPVTLEQIPLSRAHSTQLDTALSVVVSATEASGEPSIIDLPVQEHICAEPMTFRTRDASKVQLRFDIVPTYAGTTEPVIGRAVALLSSVKPAVGSKRCTLQGDLSVPIVAASTLDVIGAVHFNFLVITPFEHPNMSITEEQTYWKTVTSTTLIGHRGLGKNVQARKSLQLGENTIQSFIAAANLGASYVEFDVQVTKDDVPVIYHDFLVSETGIDAPVHTLTLEQFLHISNQQTPRPSRPPSPVYSSDGTSSGPSTLSTRKQRSYSASSTNLEVAGEMRERMKHTRAMKEKGFKGNSRGDFIQAPFTTLEEMFKKLPESIGFNIEMKYPMLFESEAQGMDTYAVEPNTFVDSVLEIVYRLGKNRNIIFSSFNPDICLLLSFKQPSIPVLFLTDAGTDAAGDIRAGSLQEAIRFASRWNLLGIVTAVEPLIMCPRLVRVVKESGLVCVSYGTMNNIPENVQLQVKEGIDAVIVDSVLAIRKGLTDGDVVVEGDGEK